MIQIWNIKLRGGEDLCGCITRANKNTNERAQPPHDVESKNLVKLAVDSTTKMAKVESFT